MSNEPAPEKLYWVQTGSYDLASYIPGDERYKTTEYIRKDLIRKNKRVDLIKFITWVRNHYAVNALIDNKGMVDYYLGGQDEQR